MSATSPFRDDVEIAPAQSESWSVMEAGASSPFVPTEVEVPEFEQWVEPEAETTHPILSVFPLSKAVLDALTGGLWPLAVQLAKSAGYTDVNQLTNIVFYFRHPEVIGRKIAPAERELAKEWLAIRDQIVKPALQAPPGGGAAPAPAGGGARSGPQTSPAIPASRLEWPGATADELAFMRAVYERHFKNSNVPGNSFVWDLPKDTLAPIEPGERHEARKDAAQAAHDLLAAARKELGEGVKVGIVSAYRPATLQFVIWQGKGRNGGFPAYYRIALQNGLLSPGDFGPDAVAKMARYLGGYIAFPGFSNHQDGLAIDFGEQGKGGFGTVRRNSPFHKWLQANATPRFGFHPLATEAWHWVYRGMPGGAPVAHEVSGAGGAISAGGVAVEHVPLLAGHAGRPPDLMLRWNDMPSVPAEIDVVVHFHGFWKPGLTLPTDIVRVSGLDLGPIEGATGPGRSRPTLTVLPRAHDTGVRQKYRQPDGTYKNGPYNVYTFPALVTKTGLPDLVRFSLERFAAEVGGAAPRVGRLILTAHSGGGLALLQNLRHHDPHQVHVFDALYWPGDPLAAWARRRIAQDRAALAGLDAAAAREHMAARGGALRVFYQGRYAGGTRPNSLAVLRAIAPELGPEVRDFYRVEASEYDHFQIPRQYGWRVLADAGADVPKAHQEAVTGVHREAEESEAPQWAYAMPEIAEGEDEATWAEEPEAWESSEVLHYEDLAGADPSLEDAHLDEVGFVSFDEDTPG
ncbi:MAG TPA: D-alanyl-D-alanine carboxypeptidase family protein [Solirubrobacteraceae bacterium]